MTWRSGHTKSLAALGVCGALATGSPAAAQPPAQPPAAQKAPADTGGFVIADPVVLRKCATCHARDSTGHVGRLSYLRKTPEGWEASVRRMASLAGVKLQPDEARSIVKYLSNRQG